VLHDQKALKLIKDNKYLVETADCDRNDFTYGEWLNSIAFNNNAKGIILDVRDDLPYEAIRRLREQGITIATIDDPTDRRLLVDLAFYPPVPQIERMDWKGFMGQLYVGWEWVILRQEFKRKLPYLNIKRKEIHQSQLPKILVTMGGSDPKGMTLKVAKSLALLDDQFEVTIILGPGFVNRRELDKFCNNYMHSCQILENISNMADVMAEVDLAVASFGVTAYELAAMHVPAIHICLSEDHVQSALIFQESGMAVCLGLAECLTEDKIADSIKRTLFEDVLHDNFCHWSEKLDGLGAARIAQLIMLKSDKGVYLHGPQMGCS
jgi:spore coat polysaccharide biosynthesis protein SpsF